MGNEVKRYQFDLVCSACGALFPQMRPDNPTSDYDRLARELAAYKRAVEEHVSHRASIRVRVAELMKGIDDMQ